MQFEFGTATHIIFGPGSLHNLGPIAADMGSRALVVTGRTPARAEPLLDALAEQKIRATTFAVAGEPTTDDIRRGLQSARDADCNLVIGFGGGSALDTAKAVAALLTNSGDPLDYLEVIGSGKAPTQSSMPCIAIPTTAGTGSEVTRNAVLLSPEHGIKVSIRGPTLPPRLALIDPELTHSMPSEVTASTGLDALTQVIEPYVSIRANPLVDAITREGISRARLSLRRACQNGHNAAAREEMALVSLLGGLALANAGLGAVHALAGVIGGMLRAPHGAVCARLLPHVVAVNLRALQQRLPGSEALRRYQEVAQMLTGDCEATAADGAAWLEGLCETLAVAPLASHGVKPADFPTLIEKAAVASSMRSNPIRLTTEEMQDILTRAL